MAHQTEPLSAKDPGSKGSSKSGPRPGTGLRFAGPDPVTGAGITLLGIFLMGAGGAWDLHWVFDFGVLLAVVGAVTFVLCVALSAMKQRGSSPSDPPGYDRQVLPPS